jgi:hypothetical protein
VVNIVGQLLPLMIALALSTVPITVTVTLLLAPRSRPAAVGFLIGWLVGLFVVAGLLTLFVQALPSSTARGSQPTVGYVEIVLGFATLGYGVVLGVRGRGRSPETELPKWLTSVGNMRPLASFGLAFVLNLRPKSILLCGAAALILGSSRLEVSEIVIVLLIFVAVSGSTVAVPIVLSLVSPRMMRRPLEATERWIVRNARTVTTVVVFVIGTVMIGNGMTRL